MKFIKTDNTVTINEFRAKLYQKISAPVDAMWEKLYIASSQSYLIEKETKNIGYCCVDDKESLLEIFLDDEYIHLMDNVIGSLIESKLISSASLSSIEQVSFNSCLSHSKSIKSNTFCFQYSNGEPRIDNALNLEQASIEDTDEIIAFLKDQVGFDDNFGYTENLVKRKELYRIKESGNIIATAEFRRSDSQANVIDLGVIVNRDHQGKGIATKILKYLAGKAIESGRKPQCSTTYDNIASKKAIEKAGFYCSHIIFDISFITTKKQKQ